MGGAGVVVVVGFDIVVTGFVLPNSSIGFFGIT